VWITEEIKSRKMSLTEKNLNEWNAASLQMFWSLQRQVVLQMTAEERPSEGLTDLQ
jgi:hypothetical protein